MPTIHVEPGSDALLQEIANSLQKARKVVVITGAGISTNSGIPDFRSENGLYSLIQAQFDAAAKQATEGNGGNDASDVSDERPAKKRRMSQEALESRTGELPKAKAVSEQAVGDCIKVEGDGSVSSGSADSGSQAGDAPAKLETPRDATNADRDATMTGVESSQTQPAAQELPPNPEPPSPSRDNPPLDEQNLTPLPSPKFPPSRAETETRNPDHFASSPPALSIDALRLRSRPDLMDHHTRSSSPLSSPPPISFDPYQESNDTTSSDTSSENSSRSASEAPSSASTPPLTSQTSIGSSSSRTSLPNMKGRDLFDAQIWSCPMKTSVFYTFATTLRQKVRNAQPTNSHRFVSVLRDSRKLVRCYTQNIDQLEERVGLTTSLELGAGNRYRFSVKSGRSAGVRNSLKAREVSDLSVDSPNASQGGNDEDSQRAAGESQQISSQDDAPNSQLDDKTSAATSEAGTGSNNETQTSTPSAANPAPAPPPPPNRGVECVFLHGSLAELRCFVCARTAPWDDEFREAETLAGRQPTCPHCAGATAAREERGKRALGVGKLRPDIVLYGEEHPHSNLVSHLVQHDLSLQPDMLLILGTSMRVHGLKVLVREFAKAVHDRGGKVVFVNFTKPPDSVWADVLDMWVQWDCDAWVDDLQRRKPALWLPPGTALPEEPKPKAAKAPKAPRRQSGGETGKRKDGVDAGLQKRKENDGSVRKPKRESTGATIVVKPIPEVVKEIPRLRPLDPLPREAPLQAQGPLPKEGDFMPPVPPFHQNAPILPRSPPSPEAPAPPQAPVLGEGTCPSQAPVSQPSPVSAPSSVGREMLPPPLPASSPLSQTLVSRPAKTAREPKLNPDAKRPASIRDHKLNGAYLTIKILKELKRITGESPAEPAPSSIVPAASKSRGKKGRKSIAGVVENKVSGDSEEATEDNDVKMADAAPPPTKRKRKAKAPPTSDETPRFSTSRELEAPPPAEPLDPWGESSISAMVKTRKRKRTVAWRMIRGVETQVELDENGEIIVPLAPPAAPPPPQRSQSAQRNLPHTQATFRPVPSPGFRALPEPVPSPLPSPLDHSAAVSHKSSFSMIDNGFRETDRLIAKSRSDISQMENAFQETDKLIARFQQESRPSTPVQLAPLNIAAAKKPANSPPKLAPLEPPIHSPGPRAEISSNVGSPITSRVPSTNNPFFFADPLVGHFSYPPTWAQPASQVTGQQQQQQPPQQHHHHHHHHHHHQQQQQQQQQQMIPQVMLQQAPNPAQSAESRLAESASSSTSSSSSWCPDEQLRKEQEVAMMLSVMRGASMLSPAPA